ncbi:MAG: hypothetical protein JOY93_07140 [Acidobacteriales bacterium]|nr:hypothetical protein [Terriglobales bacterium]
MKHIVSLLLFCVLCGALVAADDQHESEHHEELTTAQVGTIHFPVSCSPSAQKTFERGVALLHSFWYEEAQKAFAQAAQDDPQCAMAHWGSAMSLWHQLWDHPNAATIETGRSEVEKARALHPQSQRERDYIDAIGQFYSKPKAGGHLERATAYSHAMERLYRNYPDDREAAAFYALSLLASEPEADASFANRKQAAAVLEKLFVEIPDHPGVAHYLIHSYDKPQLAELGLPAARRYAQIAPASPHALHMPSHIFARLGLWQDDINSNLASIAATRKTAAMHMGGAGHQFHAMDFLFYAYLQSGHEAEAKKLIEEVRAMPPMEDMYGMGFDPRISALATLPARYAIELRHWSDAAALDPVPDADLLDDSGTYWARGIGAARSGNQMQARKELAQLESIHQKLLQRKKPSTAADVERERNEVEAWIAHANGRNDEALKALRGIAEKEESIGEEPNGGIPAREMLGDMLEDMKLPVRALAEYEIDLKFNPNRFNGLFGAAQAAEAAGKSKQAQSYYSQLLKICDGSNSSRPELNRAKDLVARNQ